MKSTRWMSLLVAAVATVVACYASPALADLVFYDDFEGGTVDANPTTPVIGNPWVTVGATNNNTIQANPLVDGDNGSAQVVRTQRAQATPAGREFIDLTPAQSARIAAGELLTIEFQHYQPDPSVPAVVLAIYQNSLHNFTENLVDVEILRDRAVQYYNDTPANFIDTGLRGTAGWDDVKIVLDAIADTWSVSLNGGTPVANLPFTNNGDYSTVGSILFGPSTSPVLAYTDNVRVYVGAIPEPASLVLLIGVATVLPLFRRSRKS